MPRKTDRSTNRNYIVIDYERVGTVSDRQLLDALISDLRMLQDAYGIRFFTGAKLILGTTNEYGDPCSVRRFDGSRVTKLDTTHYRPACLDYNL